ncbi:MAG TPA: hypothetical protein VMX38_23360 [Verrucomicrobiae bacterium]|nr:hypothetical protein [Verrucomicrobiae bacterium]
MDRNTLTHRLLLAYSGVLTIVLCVVLLTGAASHEKANFDEINVKRMNVVEPDGTVRLVISDKALFPGLLVKGKEYPYDRHTAGMIFFDDEGTEDGGLILGGMKNKDGQVESYGHLSFDKYMGDQLMALESGQEEGQTYSGIDFIDDADVPMSVITDALQEAAKLPPDQRRAKMREALKGQPKSRQRIHLGRNPDDSTSLELKDEQGHDRILLKVAADGTPSMQLLDQQGKVISEFPAKPR